MPSIIEILIGTQTVATVVVYPLVLLYTQERVKNLARESTEKALADYKHSNDQLLAAINAGHQRRVQEFGLFAQRRNEVYADAYSLFEKARGGYAQHFATITQTRDFSASGEADLRHLAKSLKAISEGERSALIDAIAMHDWGKARNLANELFERDSIRSANRAFYAYKRAWVLHALYWSPQVGALLSEAMQPLSMLSIFADELLEEDAGRLTVEDRRKRTGYVTALDDLAPRLRAAMQAEMNPS